MGNNNDEQGFAQKLKFSMIRPIAVLIILLVSNLATSFAMAQEKPETKKAPSEPAMPKIKLLPPAYDQQMQDLAEALGTLHYLRELCSANEGQTWRNQMDRLLTLEQPTEQLKAQLIARFNRGFRGYHEIYRRCTPTAATAANRQRLEAMRLVSIITNRFGN